ncbi:MAG: hypothetical protein ACREKE_09975, partial [bacterium]
MFVAGARVELGLEMRKAESQQLGAFALAAREAALDQQPLDLSDFMRSALRQPGVEFAGVRQPDGFLFSSPSPLPAWG